MKAASAQTSILDQQLALDAYLDALLDGAQPQDRVVAPERTAAGPATLTAADCANVESPKTPAAAPAVSPPVSAAQAPAPGVPEWAGTGFQALLFEVAGLTLAVPLVKLKGVVNDIGGLTPGPGPSPLAAGVFDYQGLQAQVVDTARLVLPAERAAQLDDNVAARCHHLVMIDEGRRALACTRIGEVIELDSAAVRWRGERGKRLWLAGTVIGQMCALLDTDQLCRTLPDVPAP
jgi:purine-binding chemotaxis protein CheW